MQKPLDVPLLLKTITELLLESPEKRLKRLVGAEQSTRYIRSLLPPSSASTQIQTEQGLKNSNGPVSQPHMKRRIVVADPDPRSYSQLRKRLLATPSEFFLASKLEDAIAHFDVRTADLLPIDLDVPGDRICQRALTSHTVESKSPDNRCYRAKRMQRNRG